MQAGLLPLFPLQVVVFPRVKLPLHIFEERYKLMVGRSIKNQTEFGIVLARDNGIVNAGCTVVVDSVLKQYPDGRMDILTRGVRRFEILSINEEESYLQGAVEYFDDDVRESVPEEIRTQALTNYKGLMEAGAASPMGEPNFSDPQLSFQLAQGLADLDFLSLLLRNRSETARLKELNTFLIEYVPKHRERNRMKDLAPRNGFGRRHVEA